ncbi:MAG: hypothetical protein ABFD50_19335 [Smithella sp.]
MTNEQIKTLWKFQQLVKANENFKAAEEQLKTLRHSFEDAVYRTKEAEELSTEEFQEYHEMEQLLLKVQNFIYEQNRKVDNKMCKVGYQLEKALGSDEE